ncbi:hypothetical protein GQ457_05G031680 [Hibiscus cannabinus]
MHNMFIKRLSSHNLCPRCVNLAETTDHVSKHCFYVRQVWDALNIHWPNSIDHLPFCDWLEWLFLNLSIDKHKEIAIILWAIWFSRNKFVHEGVNQIPISVATFVQSYLVKLKGLSANLAHHRSHYEAHWSPSPDLFVKLNFDGSFYLQAKKSWSGLIIRDSVELILASAYHSNSDINSAFEAEALAAVQGLDFAKDLGFHQLIVEGDSRTVINKLSHPELDRSNIHPFISDAKHLSRSFQSCRFTFVCRDENKVAHILASLGQRGSELLLGQGSSCSSHGGS